MAAAANTVFADTTALPAGIYDIIYSLPTQQAAGLIRWSMQHRDAANAATLAVWSQILSGDGSGTPLAFMSFSYELALNERLRVINIDPLPGGNNAVATIFARIRS